MRRANLGLPKLFLAKKSFVLVSLVLLGIDNDVKFVFQFSFSFCCGLLYSID
jgi:hypothetical protein